MAQAVTKDDFASTVLESEDIVLVDFWAPWCGPCQMLLPTIEALSEEIEAGAKIVKVNVDEQAELAAEHGVMSIPALKVFKGGQMVDEANGVQSKEDIIAMIDRHR
jgi:thioredoxin 1